MNFIECEVEKEFDKTVLLFATTGTSKKSISNWAQ